MTWYDIESPSREEIEHLIDEHGIPPLVAEELITKTVRAKAEVHKNLIYLILHFPTVNHRHCENTEQEIDFVIGKNFLITAHYEHIDALHKMGKFFEVDSVLAKSNIAEHAGFLFFHIIRELYKSSIHDLDEISNDLRKIEKNIFEDREGAMVQVISKVNRKLLDFKQAIRFHGDVLNSFDKVSNNFFGQSFSYYSSAIVGEYNKAQNILEGHKEILDDLRDTNDSLLSNKTGVTTKTLTIVSSVLFPLTIVAALFNIYDTGGNFGLALIIMAAVVATMIGILKHKKWL